MGSQWNFYKVYLRRPDLSFGQRQKILVERFASGKSWSIVIRRRRYEYELYDTQHVVSSDLIDDPVVIGYVLRSPKLARGRSRDQNTRVSEPASVDVETLSDSTEFIYDLDTCILAVRSRDPFFGTRTTVAAWLHLLGQPVDDAQEQYDVHVELLRDPRFTDALFDGPGDLKYVRLQIARNNPGPGHSAYDNVNLALTLDEADLDEATFTLKRSSPGSIDKSPDGVVRTTIHSSVGLGYLKNGEVQIGDHRYDLKKEAGITSRNTVYNGRDENGELESFENQAGKYLAELKSAENSDIYVAANQANKPEGE